MPKPRRKVKLDRVDAEAIREMTQSRGWKLFAARLAHMAETKRADLELIQSEISTAGLRGFLDACRSIGSIPDILVREGSRAQEGADD